jgi:hypothetical protein
MKNIAGPFSGLSKATEDALRQNLFLSERLRGLTGGFETGLARSAEIEKPVFRLPEIPPNPAYETNARLNDVLDHMGEIGLLAAESANLIRSMNDASIRMLADFGRNAQRTEFYTKITITIAAASLGITALFSVLGYFREDPADQLTQQIGALSEAQDQRTERLIAAFEARLSKQSAEDRKAFADAVREAMKPPEQTSRRRGSVRE